MKIKIYCVKEHMFFASTNPVVETNLTLDEAKFICKKYNDENLDRHYTHYQVHEVC
jgi:hypothetical protein